MNAHIAEEVWSVPMTQKAVVNAIISSSIGNDPEGMREIYKDNRYSCPDLFVHYERILDSCLWNYSSKSYRAGFEGHESCQIKSTRN